MKYVLLFCCIFINNAFANLLNEAETIIKQHYITSIDQNALNKAAIKGIVSSLDPHSNYIEKCNFNNEFSQNYTGIGIEITSIKGYPIIVSVLKNSPAFYAGLLNNDILLEVDGINLFELTLKDVKNILQGKPDSIANIKILRNNKDELSFNIARKYIEILSNEINIIDNDIAYIKIKSFSKDVAREVKHSYQNIKIPIKGVIIDLRYNSGGLLNEAVDLTSLFLNKNIKIISLKSRNNTLKDISSNDHDITHGLPIVVIINSTSASASEIVASALQDNQRAQVVGQKSFGKGSVQTTYRLSNGDILKLTTALYYTPNGHIIQNNGVLPDIVVNDSIVYENIPSINNLSEDKLQNALSSHLFKKNQDIQKIQLYKNHIIGDMQKDFQLMRAIDVIHTMCFLSKK